MLDFDELFEKYAMEYYNAHKDEMDDVSRMEAMMPELYEKWADESLPELGGITPRGFFANVKKADELIKLLIATCEGDNNPCSLLLDRIVQFDECAELLSGILRSNVSIKAKIVSANLLLEMGAKHPIDVYLKWVLDSDTDEALKEIAIEVLSENADEVSEQLFKAVIDADIETKTVIAEILINAKRDDRTYNLLIELFNDGADIPLYASYIGKYGDERAASVLYRALDDCNYLEYLEIKNAIERMGGVVDDSRDFSDDVYYKAIKNLG